MRIRCNEFVTGSICVRYFVVEIVFCSGVKWETGFVACTIQFNEHEHQHVILDLQLLLQKAIYMAYIMVSAKCRPDIRCSKTRNHIN